MYVQQYRYVLDREIPCRVGGVLQLLFGSMDDVTVTVLGCCVVFLFRRTDWLSCRGTMHVCAVVRVCLGWRDTVPRWRCKLQLLFESMDDVTVTVLGCCVVFLFRRADRDPLAEAQCMYVQ